MQTSHLAPLVQRERDGYRATLEAIAEKQQRALAIVRDNGLVFDSIGREPGNWQHLAFTLYNEICEIDVWARHALGIELGDAVGHTESVQSDSAPKAD